MAATVAAVRDRIRRGPSLSPGRRVATYRWRTPTGRRHACVITTRSGVVGCVLAGPRASRPPGQSAFPASDSALRAPLTVQMRVVRAVCASYGRPRQNLPVSGVAERCPSRLRADGRLSIEAAVSRALPLSWRSARLMRSPRSSGSVRDHLQEVGSCVALLACELY
jgi:hypothetical protein